MSTKLQQLILLEGKKYYIFRLENERMCDSSIDDKQQYTVMLSFIETEIPYLNRNLLRAESW